MNFEDFIRSGIARKATGDKSLIKSFTNSSEEDLVFLRTLELTEISARKIMSNYYDVLRAVLEALALFKGYKIYSHEAFTFFLEYIDEKKLSEQFERFRKIRNKINYYGASISVDESKDHVKKMELLITKLKDKYFR